MYNLISRLAKGGVSGVKTPTHHPSAVFKPDLNFRYIVNFGVFIKRAVDDGYDSISHLIFLFIVKTEDINIYITRSNNLIMVIG